MGTWMRSILNQKGTNKLDCAVIYGWGWIKSKTGPVKVCSMVPDWHDQRACCKP